MPRCDICNVKHNDTLYTIYKQVGGRFKWFEVCPECKKKHEEELAMTRENFRRQFGDK